MHDVAAPGIKLSPVSVAVVDPPDNVWVRLRRYLSFVYW